MAKRIISQARGKGGPAYTVKRRAFRFRIKYPRKLAGEGKVVQLINSPAHSAPLAKIKYSDGIFYIPAFSGMIEEQNISFSGSDVKEGNIMEIGNMPIKTNIYSIESRPGDGGIFVKTAGGSAVVSKVVGDKVIVMMPSKQEKSFNPHCRAVVGVIAGAGRLEKPIVKAGKMHHMKKGKGKLWPRTSAVKMNAIDHPFGSGRGKRIKSKIAKRNAPPGRRVGLLRPSRTGRGK